jgi:hypothetical protein
MSSWCTSDIFRISAESINSSDLDAVIEGMHCHHPHGHPTNDRTPEEIRRNSTKPIPVELCDVQQSTLKGIECDEAKTLTPRSLKRDGKYLIVT